MASRSIPMFTPHMAPGAVDRAAAVLRTPMIGQGAIVDDFEAALRKQRSLAYVVAVNNASSAIRLALDICGVRPGDEVVTTPLTCTLTNHPILEQFAVPVFADVQVESGNLDPRDVERRITEKTRAIVCTHWAGTPCDLDELNRIARRHGISVIEDASEALTASYQGKAIGLHSRFVAFSFHAIQILTTSEGGALSVQMDSDAGLARMKRWYGIDRIGRKPNELGYFDFDVSSMGFGYHLTNLAAVIGLENLGTLEAQAAHREAIADAYWTGLAGVPGLTLPKQYSDRAPAYHFFSVLVERRTEFCRAMKAAGIATSIVHARNDEYTIFGGLRRDLPNLDYYSERYIGLPCHMGMTDEDARYVVDAIRKGW